MASPVLPIVGIGILLAVLTSQKKAKAAPSPTPAINPGGYTPMPTPTPSPGTPGGPTYACVTPDAGMTVTQVQMALQQLGRSLGGFGADGKCGAATTADIQWFQGTKGRPQTGVIDAQDAALLRAAANAGNPGASSTYTDSNGVTWTITNPSAGTYRGDPNSKPTADYNTFFTGSSVAEVQAQIDAFSVAVSPPPQNLGAGSTNTTDDSGLTPGYSNSTIGDVIPGGGAASAGWAYNRGAAVGAYGRAPLGMYGRLAGPVSAVDPGVLVDVCAQTAMRRMGLSGDAAWLRTAIGCALPTVGVNPTRVSAYDMNRMVQALSVMLSGYRPTSSQRGNAAITVARQFASTGRTLAA